MLENCFYCVGILNIRYTAYGYTSIGQDKGGPILVPVCVSCQKKHPEAIILYQKEDTR